jgi:uncharacterized protein (DUF1800 family)
MDDLAKTSRFLMQATLGVNAETMVQVSQQGIENWLQQQLNTPLQQRNIFESSTNKIWQDFRARLLAQHGETAINGDGNDPALPYKWYFHMAWWHHTLSSQQDLLRQRIAQALSELLVISDNSSLELNAVGMGSYYDLLYQHAFGSYADLLYDVSMHPCMGVYLSHMNNQKADPSQHIHPDENYARELMQLFSIGLFELNQDGSHKTDAAGNSIPSYDNTDIKELARVFTGLHAESYQYEWLTSFWSHDYNGYPVSFNDGVDKAYKTVPFVNMVKPMQVDEGYHDRGAKRLLKGHIVLPGGQNGATEIKTVINRLVAHPNTAPYVARHFITQLVTSNPSAEYITAVAQRFGTRGDLKAVVKEVLTYPLHKPVASLSLPATAMPDGKAVQSQKLKSPLLRVTQLLRAFNAKNKSGKLWLIGDDIQDMLKQHPLSSPTVFNFYKPDFTPHGALEEKQLVAPEFELHISSTAIAYINLMYYWFFGNRYPAVSTVLSADVANVPELDPDRLQNNQQDRLKLDFSFFWPLAADPNQHDLLIEYLSLLLVGKRHVSIKPRIKAAFEAYKDHPEWVLQTICFMLAISPEFTVQEG